MTKRHNAKYKIDRRLGINLWGRAKSPYNKRTSRPGQHGAQPKKPSDYGLQLLAKQRLKGYYANIGERQFRRIYEEAVRRQGDTSQNLIGLLETRLDAVIYRMKLASTMFAARQFINHGHIMVNGKKVNIASMRLKVGDVVSIKPTSRDLDIVLSAIQSNERDVPEYIQVNHDTKEGQLLSVPKLEEVPYPVKMEPNVVVEFYSR
ncbi:MAG: 30S ribosomal protein S4 [Alphaproteobacteria bacterium]|jgi:small subunit ribosomal protein S4|nr:30S ribosomal protein S4 [Alphaproteobacteria bacterium]